MGEKLEITYSSYDITPKIVTVRKVRRFDGIRHHFFCIGWLWRNRNWENTRQKYKAMERDWRKHIAKGMGK